MAFDDLSLVGFMMKQQALGYLRTFCRFPDMSERALIGHWTEAGKMRGPPIPNAGKTTSQEIPKEHQKYLYQVAVNPRFWETVSNYDWSFQLIDVNALLAFQFDIYMGRSNELCGTESAQPTMQELLEKCLPRVVDVPSFQSKEIAGKPGMPPKGCLITSDDLNVRILGKGDAQDPFRKLEGPLIGPAASYVQVVKYDGRYYLRNGYHRAYGFGKRNAALIPCILWEVKSFSETGALEGAFHKEVFYSGNPPTMAHFIQGRAYKVNLRKKRRVIKIDWEQEITLD